ncbi:MAG: pyruvate dehydrogenase complex dihydrolipoamide acetyltransferase [Saprospiraceae bacterium]|uniref:Acetyltransferase component of pyruvate dehydrogenase complex n=1 Tax=Candidatus Opimibacter skivensis TaxID=2982028 RepID=A0A9D7XV44_9BACT|nr:pyruvate dehydrogenase complex dihydrolipoamide acetyltransferase [Candidatus Opimibacter skivensis]
MAEIIRMPRLSDTMEEGNIVGWLKKVGDKVSPGDILAEVETDKATMELESFNEGYLLYISVKEGPVPVNDILAIIGAKDEDYKSLLASAPKNESTDTPPSKKIDLEQIVIDKPISESSSTESKLQPSQNISDKSSSKPEVIKEPESRIKSSPLAKTIAADAGIDISSLTGTGDGGRIIKRDVENFVSNTKTQSSKSIVPSTPQYGEFPVSQMRKTIARRLVESKFSAPHFYLTIKIVMDKTIEARKLINEQSGLKISINDFVIKGCATALRTHPAINSSWLGDKIRVNKDINIGVAVAVDEGLLVPVLFGADQIGLSEMNTKIAIMADKARQKKLQPQEMQGNTFTVSNLGMFGIDEFTAIINPPDSAIMAVGTISDELSLSEGKVSSSKVMKVTLSCDHRVVDGATGSKFLQTFKQLLENPVAMLV